MWSAQRSALERCDDDPGIRGWLGTEHFVLESRVDPGSESLQIEALEETLPGLQKFVRPGAGDMKDFDMWLLQPVGTPKGSR